MNSGDATEQLSVAFSTVPGLECAPKCAVRDIWAHKDLGDFVDTFQTSVVSHDAAFLVLSNSHSTTEVAHASLA